MFDGGNRAPDDLEPAVRPDLLRYSHRPLGFLMHHVRARGWAHLVVLLSVLAAVGCSVGSQFAVKTLIDTLSPGPEAAKGVWGALALLACVIAADNLLWRIGGWVATGAFTGVTRDVRTELFQHLTGHLPGYFADRSPGVLASRITATSNAAWTILSTFTWNTLPPIVAVTFAIILLGAVDPVMAGTLLLVAGSLAFGLTRLAARGKPLHHGFAKDAAAVDGEMVDVISNISLVRAFGALTRERRRFADQVEREVVSRRRSLRYLEKLRLVHAVATAALTAGLLVWAVMLWQVGRASTGDIVMVTSLGFTILHGTRDLAVALVDITQHLARLSEALESLLVPHALPDREGARPLMVTGGGVSFENVQFQYEGSQAVLRGLDLDVRPGERVGLVGQSGAGKSTVLGLLQRFAAPQSGTISVDGQGIDGVTQRSLAETIAVVPQDVSLFQRTILENIRYGRPDATDAEVMEAAEAANCRDFIERLPEGFQTQVGGRGVKLSGGQRQRVAIARALLRDAPILLLDEATSALDSESEALVQDALDRLMRGRTVIAIAHRLATLRNFDRIVVMAEGKVVDSGAPAILANRPGPYRDLLRKQSVPSLPSAREIGPEIGHEVPAAA